MYETNCCKFIPFPVFQASALEKSEQHIVKGRQLEASLTSTTVPQKNGTNPCAFLSIGIIDKMYEFSSFQKDAVISEITNVILNFPIKFNPYKNTYQFADVYQAYTILFKNQLLNREMEFSEKLADDNKLYSFEIQNELEQELLKMKCSTVSSSKACFNIFHAGLYIFTVATLTPDKVVVIETHKIAESLGGSGNGIIVESSAIFGISQWKMKRLMGVDLRRTLHCSSLLLRKGRYL